MNDNAFGHRTTRAALAAFAAGLAAFTLPVVARAKLGDGFQVAAGRLKLGLDLNARYDSMVAAGLVGDEGGNVTNPGDGIALLRGAFRYERAAERLKINLVGGVDWNQYMSLFANLSAFSYLGANVTGTLAYDAGGHGFDLSESLTRSDRTNNPFFAVGVLGLNNLVKARGWYRPGGGAIEIGGTYELGVDAYTPQVKTSAGANYESCAPGDPQCNPALAAAFNGLLNRVGVDAKWRFLPKTGVTLEANYGYRAYLYSSSIAGTASAQPIRVLAGFGTLLSTRYTFALKMGYSGIIFSGAAATRNNFIGQLDFGYRVSETLSTRVGFTRSDEPVAGNNLFFSNNRLYGEVRGQFSKLVLGGLMSLDLIGYGTPTGEAATRSDTNVNVGVTADYNLLEWLRVTGRANVSARSVNGVENASSYGFNRWEAAVGVGALF